MIEKLIALFYAYSRSENKGDLEEQLRLQAELGTAQELLKTQKHKLDQQHQLIMA